MLKSRLDKQYWTDNSFHKHTLYYFKINESLVSSRINSNILKRWFTIDKKNTEYSHIHNIDQIATHIRWYSPGPPVSTNKTDRHDITEILLKVGLNTISQTKPNGLQKIINRIAIDSHSRVNHIKVKHVFFYYVFVFNRNRSMSWG